MALYSDEHVAVSEKLIILGAQTFLLLADKRPDFIALHVTDFNVAKFRGHDSFTALTG